MSSELNQEGLHEAAGHGAPGPETAAGSVASRKIVVRQRPDGSYTSLLDANHDNVVTMSELNPPRAEDGHDIAHAAIATGVIAAALVLTAAVSGVQRLRSPR